MLYTHKLTFDLKVQKPRQRIPVAYGSIDTIAAELSNFDGDDPWYIPEGTACVIRYMKANGNGGVYHVMEDGSNAWSVEENRATILLTGNALDIPGLVNVSVALVNNGRTLYIHGFDVHVDSNLLMPLDATDDLLEFKNLSEINTAIAAIQLKTDVDSTLTVRNKPADAAAVGAALAGKAPAGYGLGDTAGTWCADVNTAIKNGWYKISTSSANNPVNTAAALHVSTYDERNLCQTFFLVAGGSAQRWLVDSVWGELEWIAPPMALGVEYRTTERWNGKVVYTKLVDCGIIINNADITLTDNASDRIIRYAALASTGIMIPHSNAATEWVANISVSNNKCRFLNCGSSFIETSPNGYIHIWYFKG